ncbi:TetR/AcrR family transcriptional regulator [Streptomyces lonarensis]|uniref:TetR/AcrR family transcriptional regulator n=1 Tax=Streptomyces lonarensis TaxID=700599 RepID=A0A7X6I112_9ACTN|nr:TetR/AcrR family transcriptional regulator [Streptomyces lonarensis]
MTKRQRRAQLLDAARELIRDAGTDEFTLARLAERAGVTKPLVYDHFGDRSGVLAELYRAFEERRRETLSRVLDDTPPRLDAVAEVVAAAYIDCCLAEGRELADVVAALAGSPALSAVRQEAEDAYLQMCREALEPLAGPIDTAGLFAVIGAGDALARGALAGDITAERAAAALACVVTAVATGPRPA